MTVSAHIWTEML